MKEFSLIDLSVILFLLFFLWRGYQQGLIKQSLALIGLLLGLKIASDNYLYLATFFEANLHLFRAAANIVSFTVIMFVVMAVVNLIAAVLAGLTQVLFLSIFDRVIGAVLGFLKGSVVVYLALLLVAQIPYNPLAEQLDKSIFARDLLELTPQIQENIDRLIRE